VVKELTVLFLRKLCLSDLSSISSSFPCPEAAPINKIQKTQDQVCGAVLADCGCPREREPPTRQLCLSLPRQKM